MESIAIVMIVLAIVVFLVVQIFRPRKKEVKLIPMPDNYRQLLTDHVAFYRRLNDEDKQIFEGRVQHFLSEIRITGVRTEVEDIDRILIGASAIIPIFAFPGWKYINLNEVLLYPEAFSEEFQQEGNDRAVLGMVGYGAMQRVMVISKYALREGFSNKTDKNNTAIHEFVHLIDKTDGTVDGVPEILLQHQYTKPWLDMMHANIKEMMKGKSDINIYGATNEGEFLAVISEYFFERPDLLKNKHPELYEMLERMFRVKTNQSTS